MLSWADIRVAADKARSEHWPGGDIPVDIDLVLERMGIDIVPEAGLRNSAGVEACISADLSCIYVDLEYARNPRMYNRVRFSLAHEFGHVLLHQHVFEAYRANRPDSVLAWADLIRRRFETEMLEREADEFAGRFLVPRTDLKRIFYELYPVVRQRFLDEGMNPDSLACDVLNAYMANAICQSFQVSSQVVKIRLSRDKVGPDNVR